MAREDDGAAGFKRPLWTSLRSRGGGERGTSLSQVNYSHPPVSASRLLLGDRGES